MKSMALALLAGSALLSVPAQAALVVHTSAFISSPTNFNGFEGIGSFTDYHGPYTEGGITVQYSTGADIWTASQAGEGTYSWYTNGGASGYTSVKLANNGTISAIQFLAGSGFFGGGANLAYELLNGGVSVASGVAGPVPGYNAGFATYGFSGIAFNEVRLKSASGATSFNPTEYEAGAFDSFAIGAVGGAVPEPASWALMIGGFGFIGAAMRRRRAVTVRYA
jgi:hypothetical protein